jgi:2-dehydropantoate 2-reductase
MPTLFFGTTFLVMTTDNDFAWTSRARVCVVGAGAIGGFFGARLGLGNASVSVLARGATLSVLQSKGWAFESAGKTTYARVNAVADCRALGVQDLVFITVKAYALPEVIDKLSPLIGPNTMVIPAMNGIPWWFDGPLNSVDPGGLIAAGIPLANVIGAVVYPACSTPSPGVCRHASGSRLVFGEVTGGPTEAVASPRMQALVDFLKFNGFDAELSGNIRAEVWRKLLGNACFNPVSLLCESSTDQLIDDPHVHALFVALMLETIAVGKSLGIDVGISPDDRIAITRKLGAVKTSMLQDAQAQRRVELSAILGAVIELARRGSTPTPSSDAVYALAKMRARTLGVS